MKAIGRTPMVFLSKKVTAYNILDKWVTFLLKWYNNKIAVDKIIKNKGEDFALPAIFNSKQSLSLSVLREAFYIFSL